ncbi:MAG: hypothetical protein ACFFD4_07920 [Candidatus Odinarchaeota archaeon]
MTATKGSFDSIFVTSDIALSPREIALFELEIAPLPEKIAVSGKDIAGTCDTCSIPG